MLFFLLNNYFHYHLDFSFLPLIVGIIGFSFTAILVNNPIYAILFLILLFVCVATFYVKITAHFLGLVLVIVYLGAVGVLFLFVVMMLNIKVIELRKSLNYIPFLIFFIISLFLYFGQSGFFYNNLSFSPFFESDLYIFLGFKDVSTLFMIQDKIDQSIYNTGKWIFSFFKRNVMESFGLFFYCTFFFQFWLAGLALFVAILGAIFLTLEETLKKSKKQLYYEQILFDKNIFRNEIL